MGLNLTGIASPVSSPAAEADPRRQLYELELEQWHRRCRQDFLSFAIEALSAQSLQPAAHHRLICARLQAIAEGDVKRLMILAPPGSAKTTYTSRLFPAWFLARRPGSNIIGASHTASLAEENSGHIQRIIRDQQQVLDYKLANDAKDRWHVSSNGAYLAAGVGGVIRGFRADLAIIDDPIKSYEEAESETYRTTSWTWFTSDLLSRMTPFGRIVLIATPMHEDDLMGRLLRLQAGQWEVLRLPAISEGEGDPLDRPAGTPLWSDDRYGYGQRLLELQAAAEREGRTRDWYGQYQGRPRPPEGAMFKPTNMPILDLTPHISVKLRAWDFAASSGRGDYSVGLLLGRTYDQRWSASWIVLDVVRLRGGPEEVRKLFHTVVVSDGYGTKNWIPRDPGSAGIDQATSLIKLLPGYRIEAERMTGAKEVRADAAASQANIGKIALVRAPWNAAFLEELAAFPRGVHDDQVDALSLAFSKLANDPLAVWMRL
jgi:predicted phage terminase large subunit-like protein